MSAESVLFTSEPMRIGKTMWRLVVFSHSVYGNCTKYEWLNERFAPHWAHYTTWPSYDTNDTYSGIPKSLIRLYNRNLETIAPLLQKEAAV